MHSSTEDINAMLVNQLKDELKSRGASTVGKKAELAARLTELIAQEEGQNEGTEPVEVKDDSKKVIRNDSSGVCDAVVEEKVESQGSSTDLQSASDSHNNSDGPLSQSAAKESEAGFEVQNEVVRVESDAKTVNAGYTHVRIDNFQRPLTQKALMDWIESQVGCKLATEAIWINSIKTHCYVDFATEEEATRCVETVTGKKFPLSSPYLLEADFTSVSAKDAPQSVEGSLKPGCWKVVPTPAAATSSPQGNKLAVSIPLESNAMETSENGAAAGLASSSHKRKLEDSAASPTASNTATTPSNKAQRVAGLDIFRRVTAGILLGRPAGAGNSNVISTVYEAPKNTSAWATRQFKDGEEGETSTGESGGATTQENSDKPSSEGVSLEDLFRKTTTATPALYWLPAPDEVVQQRLKSRLMSKGSRR